MEGACPSRRKPLGRPDHLPAVVLGAEVRKGNCVPSDLRWSRFQVCPKETTPYQAEAAPPLDPVTVTPALAPSALLSPHLSHTPRSLWPKKMAAQSPQLSF